MLSGRRLRISIRGVLLRHQKPTMPNYAESVVMGQLLPYRITLSTERSLHDGHTRNYRTSTEELVLKINEMPDGSK